MPPKPKKSESATVATAMPSTPAKSQSLRWDKVITDVVSHYIKTTPQRTKLIDVFIVYLTIIGAIQFLYCIISSRFVCD